MKNLCTFALLAAMTIIFTGCQPPGPEMHMVTGTVTFDGEPVAQGDIVFRDTDGQTRGYGGQIVDGKYEFECEPGSKKVEISAMREVPGKMDTSNPGEEVPLMEQYIPEKFGAATTLTTDVSGPGPINFDLKSE